MTHNSLCWLPSDSSCSLRKPALATNTLLSYEVNRFGPDQVIADRLHGFEFAQLPTADTSRQRQVNLFGIDAMVFGA